MAHPPCRPDLIPPDSHYYRNEDMKIKKVYGERFFQRKGLFHCDSRLDFSFLAETRNP